jgi:hypothetical protein
MGVPDAFVCLTQQDFRFLLHHFPLRLFVFSGGNDDLRGVRGRGRRRRRGRGVFVRLKISHRKRARASEEERKRGGGKRGGGGEGERKRRDGRGEKANRRQDPTRERSHPRPTNRISKNIQKEHQNDGGNKNIN